MGADAGGPVYSGRLESAGLVPAAEAAKVAWCGGCILI